MAKKPNRKVLKTENKKLIQRLKQKKDGVLDNIINEADQRAFKTINCFDCANCCKTTGPLFTNKDITRIAKHLKLKPGAFVTQHLRIDEDDDYVLQQLPCPFLGVDNYCLIYDVRPKACSDYPLTGMRAQKKMLPLLLKNAEICPAVEHIVEELKQKNF